MKYLLGRLISTMDANVEKDLNNFAITNKIINSPFAQMSII